MRALAPTAQLVAQNNPDLSVYHMHDPVQDRPMLEAMAYMRLKRLRLGPAYERFLEERLADDGSIILLDCTRTFVADFYRWWHRRRGLPAGWSPSRTCRPALLALILENGELRRRPGRVA
ncbi:hypothetical protein [Nonomuraea sp. 10N515B]|uniref:hypothetical protein n=1 Tax=Nonomuraea sp. 10N515B TaxID=3457422 RepID=UPI003FCDF31A